ncbi:NAD(P)-binding protein [Litorivivens sp.]|uniref:NAD(P)-binding protein n=1 Tax=Litorivivens sp. TaxID=2020868 RepID=UPI0035625B5F
MTRNVTRRDLLNGIAIGTGAGMLAPSGLLAAGEAATGFASKASRYYPPTLTGMRGSHPGSFEVAHDLAWRGKKPEQYQPLDEHYDLVVVGAGMSGLAAAWYYRKQVGHDARILILDNHDDFGGHAKRNEFHYNGRMLLGLGGAQNIEGLGSYSDEAVSLMNDIGIDQAFMDKLGESTADDYGMVLSTLTGPAQLGMAIPGPDGHVAVGGQWLLLLQGQGDYVSAIRELPLSTPEQDKLITLVGGDKDYLADLSLLETWEYIKTTPYNQFLTEKVGLAEETIAITNAWLMILGGYTGWNYSVLEACAGGSPGFRAIGWLGKAVSKAGVWVAESYLAPIRMFPDGNASVARLLVQKMIPMAAPDMKGTEDVVTARFDYSALDRADNPTRIRLNSTAVRVQEVAGEKVEVDYVQNGTALRVSADRCILACYNGIIPHLCPQLPDEQKQALQYGVKIPFVYANVLLKDSKAFSKLSANFYQCPNDPFQWVASAPDVAIGGYEPPRTPEDPMLMFMMSSPMEKPPTEGMHVRDVLRLARHKVYATTFAEFEQQIRNQLQSLLGKHGFNHTTDIKAITVNRIPHGYAYSYSGLHDPAWEEGKAPHEIGRRQFGRISIANSDSEATPLMNAATDAAWRAVQEQLV